MMDFLQSFKTPQDEYGPVPVWNWQTDASVDNLLHTLREFISQGIHECVVDAKIFTNFSTSEKQQLFSICSSMSFSLWLYLKGWIYTPQSELNFTTLRLLRYPILENRVLNLAQYDGNVQAIFLQKGDEFRNIPNVSSQDQVVLLADEADQLLLFQEEAYIPLEEEKTDLDYYIHLYEKEFNHTIKGFFLDPIGFYRFVRDISSQSHGKKILWNPCLVASETNQKNTIDSRQLYRLWFDEPSQVSQFRVQYYTALNSVFKKHYSKPILQRCKEKNIDVIGRFHFDEFLNESIQNYRHSDVSTAIFSYAEKLTSSASWINREKRTISETYAFSQWEPTLQKMKANADWEFLKGIDKVLLYGDPNDPDVSKYSYWENFHQYSDYVKRMGFVLSNSERLCKVGVFYPIKSSYGLMVPNQWEQVDILETLLSELSNLLLSHQIDHNFINHEKLMEETLDFSILIFCRCQCLYLSEIKRLQKFVNQGGSIVFLHSLPSISVNAKNQDAFDVTLATLLQSKKVRYFSQNEITNPLTFSMNPKPIFQAFQEQQISSEVRLLDPDPNIHIVHRKAGNKNFYFIANTGPSVANNAIIFPDQHKLEIWNAENGKAQPIRIRYHEKKDVYSVRLYPYETKLFVNDPEKEIVPSSVFVFQNGHYKIGGIPLTVNGIPSAFVLRGDWLITINTEDSFVSNLSSLQQLYYEEKGIFQVTYRKSFVIPNEYLHFGLVVDLGDVRDNAELYFNGKSYGLRCWPPYRYQIFKSLLKGENTIEIRVTGRIPKQTIGLNRREGLMGPVQIIPYQAL
jgi:hypothetical protein